MIKIKTWQEKNYEEVKKKLQDTHGVDYIYKLWNASIDGYWYDDSNPSGRGDTEQEAIDMALDYLREMHEGIGEFLKLHTVKK